MITTDHLGTKVQDDISGMEGIVTAVAEHLTGCTRVGVHPDNTDDTTRRGSDEFFYAAQLTVIGAWDVDQFDDPVTDVDFECGERVRDEVTGFGGVVGTITYELFNCPRICVIQVDEDGPGDVGDTEWFDAPRAESVDSGVVEDFQELVENDNVTETGAPSRDILRKEDLA